LEFEVLRHFDMLRARLRVAGCELRVTGCELRVTGCELRVASCGLRVFGFDGLGDFWYYATAVNFLELKMSANKIFVGRDAELKQFKKILEDKQGQAILVVGQAGKSQRKNISIL